LVEFTGWTLEQIDSLRMEDFHEWLQVEDGMKKAKRYLNER